MVDAFSERSRIRAALVNSGLHSFEEADAKLASSTIAIVIDDPAANTLAGQAALLTAAVTSVRCFGAVSVRGALDRPLLIPLPRGGNSLATAVVSLGATISAAPSSRTVLIGPCRGALFAWAVQAHWNGWIAGVTPASKPISLGRCDCALAGVAAAGEAIAQAFLAEQGDRRAGASQSSISLWAPDPSANENERAGPESFRLPRELWLLGLGNLGQAFVWSLTMVASSDPQKLSVYVQDDDSIDRDNWGTSVLVERERYGELKTRVAEVWLQSIGAKVRRIDRRLDEHLRRTGQEPAIALVGFDRMSPRRLLGNCGFRYVIDAGLGAAHDSFRQVRVNVFSGAFKPRAHFVRVDDDKRIAIEALKKLPAYMAYAANSEVGDCGAALLAGKSVAAPFVSAVAAAHVLTQAIRIESGAQPYRTIVGTVGSADSFRAAA